jgi:hypothetical protein
MGWSTAAFFDKPLGSANGIRNRVKTDTNEINALQAEMVGFQHLSLRQYAELRTTTLEPAPPRSNRQDLNGHKQLQTVSGPSVYAPVRQMRNKCRPVHNGLTRKIKDLSGLASYQIYPAGCALVSAAVHPASLPALDCWGLRAPSRRTSTGLATPTSSVRSLRTEHAGRIKTVTSMSLIQSYLPDRLPA